MTVQTDIKTALLPDHIRLARGMAQVLWTKIESVKMVELSGCEELCESIILHLEAEMGMPGPQFGGGTDHA